MSKFIPLITLFIINCLLTNQKLCGENEIPHCYDCDSENSICTKCEDKYYVLFGGLECVRCDDNKYGQPACIGNCDGSRFSEIKKLLCIDRCVEGYYNIEGLCILCSDGSPNCVKCSYEISTDEDKMIYTCLECVDGLDGEYRISTVDGKCRKCNQKPSCLECQFVKGTLNDYICTKCPDNYYLSNGRCHLCSYQPKSITGGTCYTYYCPGVNHNNNDYCSCSYSYVLVGQDKCEQCPSNCNSYPCNYDQNTKSTKCSACIEKYALTDQGKCESCPSNCNTCHYDKNSGSTKCDSCYSYYALTDIGTCQSCPNNCYSCHYDKNSGSTKCDSCYSYYAPTDIGTCQSCPSNCYSCYYDKNSGSTKCDRCYSDYIITGQGKCESCPSNCYSCYYDNNASSVKCSVCNSNYVLNSNKECTYCGNGCSSCKLVNGEIECVSCYSYTSYVLEDKICKLLSIPLNCQSYKNQRFNSKDEVICTSCPYRYTLDGTNNKCLKCPNYCTYCHLDGSERLICDGCDPDYVLNGNKTCEFCTNNIEIGGEGCIHCLYENGINKCTQCRNNYTYIINDFVCKIPSEINLNEACVRATRLGNGEYDCNNCRNINYTMITRYNSTNDCYLSEKEIVNCRKGYEDENLNLTCTNCLYDYRFIWSEVYQKDICDDKCGDDSFFNYDLDIQGCFKCDNETGGGQIGCDPKRGCGYRAVDNHLYCNRCKTGYFLYDWQCLPCSKKDSNCLECDFNKTEDKFRCFKCRDDIFYINKTDLCDVITYNEYPEVTAGCILPINNYTIYKKNNKCFDCKYGFFKTKEESCIYCKARKNGGPKCDECQYIKDKNGNETDSINCKICQNDNMISPIGRRCYNCEDEVGPGCAKCVFENVTERVICEECIEGYELNEEKYCSSGHIYSDRNPNCLIFMSKKKTFLNRMLYVADAICIRCNDGYYLNKGKCESLSLEKCSFNSMLDLNNLNLSIYDECKKFCEINNYPFVDYKENNEKIEYIIRNNLNISESEKEIKDIIENNGLCLNNIDDNNGLRRCIQIEYDSNTKNYKCLKCMNGYQLNSKNRCEQTTDIEKNITKQECNEETIFIKSEKGTFCEKPIGELEGCANGTIADTQYVNNKYNCYNCSSDYHPFFSYYFKRTICVGAAAPTTQNINPLPSDAYKGIDKDTDIKDGKCLIKDTFSPDGENCYLCNNDKVGMPGCSGSCTFSLKRNNILECEEGCKSGYLETSQGICESCDIVNKGCLNCIYNNNYPVGYSDFQRQRRFECNECEDGYQLAKDGYCHHCSEFGFTYCDKCIRNKNNNELECLKCIDGYFLANNGYCNKCEAPKVQGTENRCIFCNNTVEGGIKGCELCFSDNGNIACQQCAKGFILSEDDKTCIGTEEYEEIKKYTNCQKISRNNSDEFKCTKCTDNYNYLYDKNRNEEICVNSEFLLTPKPETLKYCKKYINMGTEDRPKHSCEKCIDNDILTQEQREQGITFTKITFPENETSFCDISSQYGIMQNCSEARRINIEGGETSHNCTKCIDENKFIFKLALGYKICTYFFYSNYCMVKNCRTCKYGNNYFCSICLLDNYEVNPATGSCIKKRPKEPIISWKDWYGLKYNDTTQLNTRNLDGVSLYLRGISGSQFNSGYAFKVDLIFDILYNSALRNIEENDVEIKEIKIPSYCQIIGHTDEVKYKVNLIDYYCFANRTGEDEIGENQIRLKKIEISHDDNVDNSEFIEFSNFENLIPKINLEELKDKDISSFTLKKFNDITVFEMDKIVDQKSDNYTFDFTISGRINKELEPDTIHTKFELRRIKNLFVDCEFNIKENQTAELNCHVNLEDHKDREEFKFRTIEFQYKQSSIYINRFNEIKLVHEEKQKEKKSYILIILIIVASIVLAAIIAIFIYLLYRNLHKKKLIYNDKKDDYDIVTKYGLAEKTEKPKKPKRSIKNKSKYTLADQQTIETKETRTKKRSIKNKKGPEKLQNVKVEVKLYNKNI